jgi:hypothetical protein
MKELNKVVTSRKVRSRGYLVLAGFVAVLAATTSARTAAAQAASQAAPMQAPTSRGSIAVLELRAPDGEDEVASSGTEILRAQARDAGFEVAAVAQSLEQLVAAFGCDDAVPLECLQQISTHTHQNRFLFGSVRRGGPRRATAPVRMEVRLYDNGTVSAPQTAETPRAQAMDTDQWRPQITRIMTALLPAPAVTNNNNVGDGHNVIVTPPPTQPRPLRRYIGFGLLGLGGVFGVVGLVSGIQWLSLSSAISADAMAAQSGGMRSTDDGVRGLNNLMGSSNNESAAILCADLNSNASSVPAQYEGNNVAMSRENALRLCQSAQGMVLREGLFFGIGAALIGVGLVLVVTDNSSNVNPAMSPSSAQSAEQARMMARANRRPVQWALTPAFAPQQQGAVFTMAF